MGGARLAASYAGMMSAWLATSRAGMMSACLAAMGTLLVTGPANARDDTPGAAEYSPTPDSLPQPEVPAGATFKFVFDRSTIFPGTTRDITVYVPASYAADKPACVYIGLDGLGFEAATAFDNLIAKHDIPLLIAVGIAPGTVTSRDAPENPRFDRSAEFDDLSDDLARFVLAELLPEVERHKTPGGLAIRLSRDPNDRAVGGFSTGGIGAFTLAWRRPDAFRRVFTAIGTFVDMRGGDHYPAIVRRTEHKPIKVFMQDGSNDQLPSLGEIGDWWLGNQTLYSALRFSGYEVEHVWGEGNHSPKHATQVFPDAMRWLWKRWPQPITAGESQNVFLKQILSPDEGWEQVAGEGVAEGTAGPRGSRDEVMADRLERGTDAVRGSRGEVMADRLERGTGAARAPRGEGVMGKREAGLEDAARGSRSGGTADGFRARGPGGRVYQTQTVTGELWMITREGKRNLLDSGLKGPTGVALSPDGLWLAVAESQTRWGYSYRVETDGTVRDKQRYYEFERAGEEDASGAAALVMDREGRLYGATRAGVQVFDRNGRARAILPLPLARATDIYFGGENLEYLYVSGVSDSSSLHGNSVGGAKGAGGSGVSYRRRLKVAGVPPGSAPIGLPTWGPG
jgi:gluconolactonase